MNGKKILLRLVLVAILLEISMRSLGNFLQSPSNQKNIIVDDDFKKIRILTIGESTTADFFSEGRDVSWPRILELKLRDRGLNARVYNEGLGGTISPLIIARMPEFIDKYKPHIVISMMGVNDPLGVKFENTYLSRLNLVVYNIRILKLLRWIKEYVDLKLSCNFEELSFDVVKNRKILDDSFSLSKTRTFKEIETHVRKLMPEFSDKDIALLFLNIAYLIRGDMSQVAFQLNARPYLERAFELYPFNRSIAFFNLNGVGFSDQYCIKTSKVILQCGKNVPDDLLAAIAICMGRANKKNEVIKNEFTQSNISFLDDYINLKSYHYRVFHEQLKAKKITHIAMQYPTLPVNDLRSLFTDKDGMLNSHFKDIIFISNEYNFKSQLKIKSYDKIFFDRFRGSWGHTTKFGHEMIADNLISTVEEVIKSQRFIDDSK